MGALVSGAIEGMRGKRGLFGAPVNCPSRLASAGGMAIRNAGAIFTGQKDMPDQYAVEVDVIAAMPVQWTVDTLAKTDHRAGKIGKSSHITSSAGARSPQQQVRAACSGRPNAQADRYRPGSGAFLEEEGQCAGSPCQKAT